jgi:hypothetical protein
LRRRENACPGDEKAKSEPTYSHLGVQLGFWEIGKLFHTAWGIFEQLAACWWGFRFSFAENKERWGF